MRKPRAKTIPPIEERDWITEPELAERWGMAHDTLRRRRQRGKPLPPVAKHLSQKPFKYMKADVTAFEKNPG